MTDVLGSLLASRAQNSVKRVIDATAALGEAIAVLAAESRVPDGAKATINQSLQEAHKALTEALEELRRPL